MSTSRQPSSPTPEATRLVAVGLGVGASTLARLGVQRIAGRFLIGDIEIVPTTHMTVTLAETPALPHSERAEPDGAAECVATRTPGQFDGIDHLVRVTADLDAELTTLGSRGIAVRRTASRHGRRQAFCWLGTPTGRVILEVVEDAHATASRWWGVTLTSADLTGVARHWGLPAEAVKPALQSGRSIVVHPGIDEPGATPARLAVMSPHVAPGGTAGSRLQEGRAEGSEITQRTDESNGLA